MRRCLRTQPGFLCVSSKTMTLGTWNLQASFFLHKNLFYFQETVLFHRCNHHLYECNFSSPLHYIHNVNAILKKLFSIYWSTMLCVAMHCFFAPDVIRDLLLVCKSVLILRFLIFLRKFKKKQTGTVS